MVIDEQYKLLLQYREQLSEYLVVDLSEADTRAKFIDFLLTKILRWPESEIKRERNYVNEVGKAAIDYEIGLEKPIILVEAKKQLKEFELPRDGHDQFLYAIDGIVRSCPNIYDAVLQARSYCDDWGIPFAIVTNGRQFGLFRAVTEGHPWHKGKIAIFDLQTLCKRRFVDVFESLSYESCSSLRIDRILGLEAESVKVRRIGDCDITQAGRFSNKMLDVVQNYIAEVFQDPPEPDKEFLENCYVKDSSRDFYAKAFRALLSDPMPVFARELRPIRPGHKKDPFSKTLASSITRKGIRPPTIIIGGKGYGKTTFLNWVLKVGDSASLVSNAVVVWLDFKEISLSLDNSSAELKRLLCQALCDSPMLNIDAFSKLEQVFNTKLDREVRLSGADEPEEIRQLKRRLVAEWRAIPNLFLDCLVEYSVNHCDRQILVILDNADQKDFAFQKRIFEFAHEISSKLPLCVIASLREGSYFRLCQTSVADAFSQQQVFHIQAPDLSSVLANRFDYLARILERKGTSFESASGHTIRVEDLSKFVNLLKRSLLESRDSGQIQLLLSAISNGSIRMAFQMFHDFLVSGHTKMEDYFWKYAAERKANIPYHEFFGSVLLDEMSFFSETNSHMFLNIFSRSQSIDDSHFLRLRVLRLTEYLSKSNSFKPEDYVKLEDIRDRFQKIGVSRITLEGHIKSLIRFGLLLTDTQQEIEPESELFPDGGCPFSVHISASGRYYLENIFFKFEYLSKLIADTPLTDQRYYECISSSMLRFSQRFFEMPLKLNLEVTTKFFEYLLECENREIRYILPRDEVLGHCLFMSEKEAEFRSQIAEISAKDNQRRETQQVDCGNG